MLSLKENRFDKNLKKCCNKKKKSSISSNATTKATEYLFNDGANKPTTMFSSSTATATYVIIHAVSAATNTIL